MTAIAFALVSPPGVPLGATLVEVGTDPTHPDERALVARAVKDFDAFAELYRRYLPEVHAYAFRRTGRVDSAEDICSATFEAALRSIGRFRWTDAGFRPWLFRIASRQVVAHYRREARGETERGQRAMAEMVGNPAASPDDFAPADEDSELRVALGRLNPRYQRAISLRYMAGLDTTEAARAMGLTNAVFSVVLSRATKALRRELDAGERRPEEGSS